MVQWVIGSILHGGPTKLVFSQCSMTSVTKVCGTLSGGGERDIAQR